MVSKRNPPKISQEIGRDPLSLERGGCQLELDTGAHGRVDVLVMNSSIHGRNFLFELKYLPKGKSSAEAVSAKLAEAKAQLLQYRIAPRIKSVPRLDCWAVVFAGGAATAAEKV